MLVERTTESVFEPDISATGKKTDNNQNEIDRKSKLMELENNRLI